MSAKNHPVTFDHHAASFVSDHERAYAELRAGHPVSYTLAHGGFWIISKYEDVFNAARDDATFSSAREVVIPATEVGRLIPLQSDPPDLDRYRGILSPHFTPKSLALVSDFAQRRIDHCLDAIECNGGGDVVQMLANPVPSSMTMFLLGLDPDEWRVFADPIHVSSYSTPGTAENTAARNAVTSFTEIIEHEVDDRILHPRDDMISKILATEWEGERTTRQEAIDLVRMVIFGGMDTVMAAISNIFVRLGQSQSVQGELRRDPSLIPNAVEEFLRIDAPVQGFARTLTADAEIAGETVNAGETVFMLWASANRDEAVFGSDASSLDIRRSPNRHMTFGVGGHRCMGSTLARMELRAVLEKAFQRFSNIQVDLSQVQSPPTIGIVNGHRVVPISVVQNVFA